MFRIFKWISLLCFFPLQIFAQTEQVYIYSDFSGGMLPDYNGAAFTNFTTIDADPKYGLYMLNVDCENGRLRDRMGYEGIDNFGYPILPGSIPIAAFQYTINKPNIKYLENPNIYVVVTLDTASFLETYNVNTFHMKPRYIPTSGMDSIGLGRWDTTQWSYDLNDYFRAPGRIRRLVSSDIYDFQVVDDALRMTAGNEKGDMSYLNGEYTYPWWFGYIGRYRWNNQILQKMDGFYLYSASLDDVPPSEFIKIDSIYNPTYGNPGWEVENGKYFFKYVWEYDGYQYGPVDADTTHSIYIANGDKFLRMTISIPVAAELSGRVTALLIFSSDPVTLYTFDTGIWWGGGEFIPGGTGGGITRHSYNPSAIPYYFRARIPIADPDSNNIYYKDKTSYAKRKWQYAYVSPYGMCRKLVFNMIKADFNQQQPLISSYINHNSSETVALPRTQWNVNGRTWAGNVNITSKYSKINDYFGNMVIISPIGQPDVLPVNNYIMIGGNMGPTVQAIREMNGNALIWTNNSFEIWQYNSDYPQLLNRFNIGCDAPRSIQVTPDGCYWANTQGIYLYNGNNVELLTEYVSSSYDSLWKSFSTTGSREGKIKYALSSYLKGLGEYRLYCDTLAGELYNPHNFNPVDYNKLPIGHIYGGMNSLVYNIKNNNWVKHEYGNWFSYTFQGSDVSSLSIVMDEYNNHPDTRMVKMFETPDELYSYDDYADYAVPRFWCSSWTDFGYHGIEKDLNGITLDFHVDSYSIFADTIKLTVYADGRQDVYDEYKFFVDSWDSFLSHDKSYRIIKYIPSDSTGIRITRPPNKSPVLYRFGLEWRTDELSPEESLRAIDINSIMVYFTPKSRRK